MRRPYCAGLSPLANGMVVLGLFVSLSMAIGMTTTVAAIAIALIVCRRWLAQLLARHGAKVERIATGLEILGAAAVTMIGWRSWRAR